MNTRPTFRRTPQSLSAVAMAVAALTLAACGGGSGEAPPEGGGSGIVVPNAPVVTITNNVAAETATGDITFTFSFNRDVGTSFTADDVMVTGGTKGAFTRLSGTGATLVVTPTADAAGMVEISVPAGAVSDAGGAPNAAVTAQKAFDTTVPVVRTTLVSFEEGTPPALTGFGGAEDSTVVTDPTDASNRVARVVKTAAAELWAGTTVSVCAAQGIARLPFSATLTTLSVRVWSPAAGVPVRLKVENSADGTQSVETEATTTMAGAWETLLFNFSSPAAGTAALDLSRTYDKASIFFNFGTPGSATGERIYYFDDLAFVGSSFTASCPSTGGGGGGGSAANITMDESPAPVLTGFGGAEDATIVDDPTGGGNKVARVVKSATAELWAGTTVSTLPAQAVPRIPFATGATTMTVRVWSPAAGIPVRLKVENSADPSRSVETEATVTVASGWQTLTFDFANQASGTAALDLAATYDKVSIFFNFGTPGSATGERIYFFEDITYPAAGSGGGGGGGGGTGATTTIDFQGAAPTFTGFGGAEDASAVADPTDPSNTVARITKSATAELWAGTTISTGAGNTIPRIAFAADRTTITARVWSPVAGIPVRMKVENAADAGQSVETEATVTTASGWQTLTFNFSNQAAGTAALNLGATYTRLSVFFDFGTPGATVGAARTYYIDDITFPTAGDTGGGGGGDGGGTGATNAINFQGTAPVLAGFGGAEDAAVVADPTDAANTVARITKSATAELWAGTTISTGAGNTIPRIAFAADRTTITARVWSPVAGIPVRMKVENAADAGQSVETEATVTTASGWQTLTFNFSNQAAGTAALNLAATYTRLSVFFDFGTTGAAVGAARTYYIDDIVYPVEGSGGGGEGGTGGTLVFSSGYREGGTSAGAGTTAQGGAWGYFSGDFANYLDTFTGGGFASSTPPVADNDQYFFIAVTTSAPTAPAGTSSGGFLGMYVTHPGLALTGQTQLAVNLGMDANFFNQPSNKTIDVFVVGSTVYGNGSGGECRVTLKGTVVPTTSAMITYTLPLAAMTLVQPCNGGGFSSGVSTVAQALAQPIGAVNTQFSFPNLNTTVNSGTAGAPIYASGITRGKTEFR